MNLKPFNGTTFKIDQKNNLYFLNKISNSNINNKDVTNLQNKVSGMNITDINDKFNCDIYTLGKMTNSMPKLVK